MFVFKCWEITKKYTIKSMFFGIIQSIKFHVFIEKTCKVCYNIKRKNLGKQGIDMT